MIFTSFEFVLFFAVIVLVRTGVRNDKARKFFLLAVSCLFYMSWSVSCLPLLLITCTVDFLVGRAMGRSSNARTRKRLLFTSLFVNLGMLGFFKYANFFLDNITSLLALVGWHVGHLHYNLLLPPAISFFTLTSLAYVMDVYYERVAACASFRDYALFVTFFPKLLSGPIVRAGELLPQFAQPAGATPEDIEIGLSYFLIGAVKKLVVAEQVANHVSLIFSAPGDYDALTLLTGVLGYTVQLYCDFAGYSDMAIGCARILGYRLPENFQMPYSSSNITEFWRRWHITLSRWFRDYLFLPLELVTRQNPNATLRISVNLVITMLLCGLWHGPSWNFVIFGGIHGLAMAVHKIWTMWKPLAGLRSNPIYRSVAVLFAHLATLSVVVLGFLFFRAGSVSQAIQYLSRILAWSTTGTRLGSPFILGAIVAVCLVHLALRKDRNLALELPRMSILPRIAGYATLLTLLALLGASEASPFIYFKF